MMSGAKFMVRGGRRWRELELDSGRVAGWGDAYFVCVRRGRLEVLRRAPVLRGLRALADGRPGNARDGLRLSQLRSSAVVDRKKPSGGKCQRSCCRCCREHGLNSTDANFNSLLKPSTSSVAVQCSATATAAVQVALPDPRASKTQVQLSLGRGVKRARSGSADSAREPHVPSRPTTRAAIEPHVRRSREPNAKRERLTGDDVVKTRARSRHRAGAAQSHESPAESNQYKELIITEQDVQLLRGFVERDERNVFGVDLEAFDEDDEYKEDVFYKVNPLVIVERCRRIARMIVERRRWECSPTLRNFVTSLGLRSVAEPVTRPFNEPDKENAGAERRARARPGRRVLEERGTANGEQRPHGAAEAPGPTRKKGNREYTAAEDEAIVRWVRGDERAWRVKGNALWRELAKRNGPRSWHSLRNRYLRYLLPTLHARELPAGEAARLRAAAAAGEMKSRKPPARRNSAFEESPVCSASARLPSRRSTSPRSVVATVSVSRETSPPQSSLRKRRTRTPTYSELTKRFARRQGSKLRPVSTSSSEPRPRAALRSSSTSSSGSDSGTSESRVSRSSPQVQASPRFTRLSLQRAGATPERSRARTRRLYNVHAII